MITEERVEEVCTALIVGVRDYFRKNGFSRAVIGISGGLDSAVCCYAMCRALGSENVIGVLLPERAVTSPESLEDAESVVSSCGVVSKTVFIDEFVEVGRKACDAVESSCSDAVIANVKARTRMMLLYMIAQSEHGLVIGTSNKSEIALGYSTKHGDGASDFLVIGDLWKSEVQILGEYLEVSRRILTKKPTAELIDGVFDEHELGAAYDVLDRILELHIVHGRDADSLVSDGFDSHVVHDVVRRVRVNEHKRNCGPLVRVSRRSFHPREWRMSVTRGM